VFIQGALQVNPFARAHLEVGLIAAPGISDRTLMGLPAFLELEGRAALSAVNESANSIYEIARPLRPTGAAPDATVRSLHLAV
jgi:hypothetical protein